MPQAVTPDANAAAARMQAAPLWPLGLPLAMHVHLSTSPTGDVFSGRSKAAGLPSLVWQNITFGDWNERRVAEFEVKLPEVRPCLPWRARGPR